MSKRMIASIVSAGICLTCWIFGQAGAASASATLASAESRASLTRYLYYELRSETSDKCLDVDGRGPGGTAADLANVQQYRCWGGANQHWRLVNLGTGYYEVRSQTNDKCLDVDGRGPGGTAADLANVQQYRCWGGANQHWRLVNLGTGYYEVRSQTNDKCLDVDGRGPGGTAADLANVQQYRCWGGFNQHWRFVRAH